MNQKSIQLFSLSRSASFALIITASFFSSCEKDPEPLTTNSCIKGSVYVYDGLTGELPEVKITAHGPYGSTTSYSDKQGEFWLKNLGNGTYDVECSLEGFGGRKVYGLQVFGRDTVFASLGTLYAIPDESLKVPELSSVQGDPSLLIIKTNRTNCTDLTTAVRFFIGKDSDVSPDNYEITAVGYLNYSCEYTISFNEAVIESGTRTYVVGYTCNYLDEGYLDMYNNIKIYPTINLTSKSNVLSFNMP